MLARLCTGIPLLSRHNAQVHRLVCAWISSRSSADISILACSYLRPWPFMHQFIPPTGMLWNSKWKCLGITYTLHGMNWCILALVMMKIHDGSCLRQEPAVYQKFVIKIIFVSKFLSAENWQSVNYIFLNILQKTLNNFCRNSVVFLEKLHSVTQEIVQCFFGSCEPRDFVGSKRFS